MPIDIEEGLAPGFLVAAPDLKDPVFSHSVILLVESNDEGAMGFIVNRTMPITLGSLDSSIDAEVAPPMSEQEIHWGGPVRPERGWLLAKHRDVADYLFGEPAFVFDDGLYVVADLNTLRGFLSNSTDAYFQLVLGYSGWGPGQLGEEMKEGTWLPLDYDSSLLSECSGEDMWVAALERMGINPAFYFSGSGPASA